MPELPPVTSARCPSSKGRVPTAGITECSIMLASHSLIALDQICDQSGPSGLMRRSHSTTAVAVEVLVEQHVVLEVRIVLHARSVSVDWACSVAVRQEDALQAATDFVCDFGQGEERPATGG